MTSVVALVISLPSETQRWDETRTQCLKAGLPVQRFDAMGPIEGREWLPDSPHQGGNLGLMASYDRILMEVSLRKEDWVLVLEDDIKFTSRATPFSKVRGELLLIPDSVACIRVGYMTGNEIWWEDMPLSVRLRTLLGVRSRLRRLGRTLRATTALDKKFPPRPDPCYGGLGVLFRPSMAEHIRELIRPEFDVVDNRLSELLVEEHPSFRQSRRPWVTQRRVPSIRRRLNTEQARPSR